jgi:hypothetical protein
MSSQHGVRFQDLPATECTFMDVDEPSDSWMSLGMFSLCCIIQLTGHAADSLDDIYLGPDKELDSDSGSSAGLDVLDEIPGMYLNSNTHILTLQIDESPPAQSHPAQGDDLSLLNAPDMYLRPQDDLIEFDDGLAMPDSPMTGECVPPISCSFFIASSK